MSQWLAVEDPSTGRTYYANSATQETSWTLPIDNNQYHSENEDTHSIESQHQVNYSSQFNTTRRNTIQSMVHFDAVWDSDGVSEGGDSWNDSDSDSSSNDGLTIYNPNKLIQITPHIHHDQTDEKTHGQLEQTETKLTPNISTPTSSNEYIHKYPTPEITPSNNKYWECPECAFKNNINYIICKICNVPKIKKHPNDSSEGQEHNIILNNDMFDNNEDYNHDIPYDLIDLLNKNKNKTNKFILENSAFQDSSDDDDDDDDDENEGWVDINQNTNIDKQLFSEIMAIIDNNNESQNIITNFATDNNKNNHNQSHSYHGNNNNNNNNNNYNESNDNNNNNNNNNNNYNNNGNNNGNGGRGDNNRDDDDKDKKYFNYNSNDNSDEKDEEEEEEEKKKEELNKNAKEFIPNYSGYKPLKKRTLSPIDEIYSDIKICMKPRKGNKMNKIIMNSYDPNPAYRAKFNVDIKRDFIKYILKHIKEKFKSLYIFMDKSLSLQMEGNIFNVFNNQMIKIINYGFHNKDTNELLYCIIIKKQQYKNKNKNKRQWEMISKLFTANDIKQIYNISYKLLPKQIQTLQWKSNILKQQNIIENILINSKEIEKIITKTSWHKLPIFNHNYNRNRKRMILKLDKPEFIKHLRSFIYINNKLNINLIPIMMFNNSKHNTYQIEYLWIVRIDKQNNIDIGISFILNENNLIVSGIHLNKTIIINQHELISYHSKEFDQCLHSFTSNITDLKIGNPDDELNKIKDLTKKFKHISHELSVKNCELDNTKKELKILQIENDKLKTMIEMYNNSSASQMIHSAQSTPELNTNINSLTSSVPLQSPSYSSSMIIQSNALHTSIPNIHLLNNNNNNVSAVIQQPLFYPYQMPNGAVILIPNQVPNNI